MKRFALALLLLAALAAAVVGVLCGFCYADLVKGRTSDMKATEYQQYKGDRPKVHAAAPGKLAPTGPDIEGPFYKPGAPLVESGVIAEDAGQPPLVVSGFVRNTDGESLDAILDVWQANPDGVYSNTSACDEDYSCRGKVRCSSDTGYGFQTVRPGDYKISEPGKPDEYRCGHIHVKLTAAGYKPLTTQLYFEDDKFNATDHWFSAARVIHNGQFDFVLEKDGGR